MRIRFDRGRKLLTEERQWAKLKLVVDTARRVWGGGAGADALAAPL